MRDQRMRPHRATHRPGSLMTPEALCRLHARAFPARGWSEKAFKSLLAQRGIILIPHAAGFLLARQAADEVEILTLAITPDQQRKGYGTELVANLLAHLQQQYPDVRRLFLEVGADNLAARALYARHGFDEIGLRPNYYRHADGRTEDALLMQRTLPLGQSAQAAGSAQESVDPSDA